MNNHITDQAKFCRELMTRLKLAVDRHESVRGTQIHGWLHDYGNRIKEDGATKTQIQASIVQLRRELNILSKMMED